jgi:hypothetical protein
MILINPDLIELKAVRRTALATLAKQLLQKPEAARTAFIDEKREETWAHPEVLEALRAVVGNKCWYSEVPLEGADPNVDHFRPKGQVREVDANLNPTKTKVGGYWWLAFEFLNFRLAAMHANQRRTDTDTNGGKWDFFPVRGARAAECTSCGAITEDYLALDPCKPSDVRLLWFDPDGKPCAARWRGKALRDEDAERVRASIWLYHLDKQELHARRSKHVQDIMKDLRKADKNYSLWAPESAQPNLQAKAGFDEKVAEIKIKISPQSDFSGAKRSAVRLASATYPWIEDFDIL